jgi:hypothetical protein
MLVVDPWDWLTENGELPMENPRQRRRILRLARFIEYGGPLPRLHCRETLVECQRRPGGRPCLGLMWVLKTEDDEINAFCRGCGDEAMIHNWQRTEWAAGMMQSVPAEPADMDGTPSPVPPSTLN